MFVDASGNESLGTLPQKTAMNTAMLASRLLGVHDTDLPGLSLSTGASLLLLGGYYFIQPLSDEMSLRAGIEYAPAINVGGLLLVAICNPLYAALLNLLPLSRVQPFLHRCFSCLLLTFSVAFWLGRATGDGDTQQLPLAFAFAIFLSSTASFLMSTFWVRMAHVHSPAEARRTYGVIAAGAQGGQLLASVAAARLYATAHENLLLLTAAAVECSVRLIERRAELHEKDGGGAAATVAASAKSGGGGGGGAGGSGGSGGGLRAGWRDALSGAPLLVSTPLLRTVTLHTLLLAFITNGLWCERARRKSRPAAVLRTYNGALPQATGVLRLARWRALACLPEGPLQPVTVPPPPHKDKGKGKGLMLMRGSLAAPATLPPRRYERADAVTGAFATSEGRLTFFSQINALVGGVTLVGQLVLFARVTR